MTPPSPIPLTRQTAWPQLGLRSQASPEEVEAAYRAAVAEIDLMTRNSRSEALSASYHRARSQVDEAYQLLRASDEAPPPAALEHTPVAAVTPTDTRALEKLDTSKAPAKEREIARLRAETAAAREEAASARKEAANAYKLIEELRALSETLAADVAKVRDRLKSLGLEAQELRETVSQLGVQSLRDLEASADVRKRADALLLSAQRNESEIATAAMHAEAYRDSAMYAAQAAERLLRALSAETTSA